MSMGNYGRKAPNSLANYKKGIRKKVTAIMMYAGGIPAGAIELLQDNPVNVKKKLYEMRMDDDEVVEKIKVEGHQVYIIKHLPEGKELNGFVSVCPKLYKQCEPRMSENRKQIKSKTEQKHRRIFRNAETVMFMDGLPLAYLPDEKVEIHEKYIENAYYNSLEIVTTEDGEITKIISGSRNNGVIFSDGGIYLIYNYSSWGLAISSNERRVQSHIKKISFAKKMGRMEISPLVLYKDDSVYRKLLEPTVRIHQETVDNLFEEYRNGYILPLSPEGQQAAEYMCLPDWKEKMIKLFQITPHKPNAMTGNIGHGTVKSKNSRTGEITERTVFLFAIPDIVQFGIFLDYIREVNDKNRFAIACYDFQEAVVRQLAGDYAQIKVCKIDAMPRAEELRLL